jgi:hypothetical protein
MDSQADSRSNAPSPVQLTREQRAAIHWAQEPLPDPTYNPSTGWKLDEFAMHCEPVGLRKYKQHSFKRHFPHVAGKINFIEYVLMLEFPSIVRKRLLEPRFRVMGIRRGAYSPEEVPYLLLERMHPLIELTELHDLGEASEIRRRYEMVRVFRLKGNQGAKPTYNWRPVADRVESDGIIYPSDIKLVKFCMQTVMLFSGEKPDPLPDDATTRGAITKYGLWKFSQEKGKPSGKKRPG